MGKGGRATITGINFHRVEARDVAATQVVTAAGAAPGYQAYFRLSVQELTS